MNKMKMSLKPCVACNKDYDAKLLHDGVCEKCLAAVVIKKWLRAMDNLLNPANAHQQRCPRCQSPLNTVVVHGHEQCVICKSNIFECCSGCLAPNFRATIFGFL
jgi:transcription initiation factor IIE alpha subunit